MWRVCSTCRRCSMPVKGKEIKTLPLESQSTVETICKLGRKDRKPDGYLKVETDVDRIFEILDKEKGK